MKLGNNFETFGSGPRLSASVRAVLLTVAAAVSGCGAAPSSLQKTAGNFDRAAVTAADTAGEAREAAGLAEDAAAEAREAGEAAVNEAKEKVAAGKDVLAQALSAYIDALKDLAAQLEAQGKLVEAEKVARQARALSEQAESAAENTGGSVDVDAFLRANQLPTTAQEAVAAEAENNEAEAHQKKPAAPGQESR